MSPIAQRLTERVEHLGRRRVDIATVQRLFAEVEPALAVSTQRRLRLREALDEAALAGRLSLSRSEDSLALPALPRFVTILSVAGRRPREKAPPTLWQPELAWASQMRLTPPEAAFVGQVSAFLRDLRPDEPVVPIRERSIEITGDEKRLDGLLSGRLFTEGRLSLDLLRCRRIPPPFIWREIGTGTIALVVENHQTYHTLSRVLATSIGAGFIIYGAGNHFSASVAYLAELPRCPERVVYFGDVDPEGIHIPLRSDRLAASLGLPPIQPATRLYELLLQHGRPGQGQPIPASSARRLVEWLPESLREAVAADFARGVRYAQEGLGLSVLGRLGPSDQLI